MAVNLLPPAVLPETERDARVSDDNGSGFGGGNFDAPDYGRNENPEPDPERWATPLSAYRTAAFFIIFSISSVFVTLTHILESRWVHSKDWVPVSLPNILYINTAVLVASSVTIEFARFSLEGRRFQRSARWLLVTLLLGLAFVVGQLVAWRELVSRGVYWASNPGSFFFYFLTAAHGLHLLGGILALSYIVLFASRLVSKGRQETAVGVVAIYWHFMDALWFYLLGLLFVTIQRG
jgi:cytochrome c oxidase subunit III